MFAMHACVYIFRIHGTFRSTKNIAMRGSVPQTPKFFRRNEIFLHDCLGDKKIKESVRRDGINWQPPFPVMEDFYEISSNLFGPEWKKRNQDMAKIRSRMTVTIPHRRSLVLENKPLVEIKTQYRALFTYEAV